MFYFIDNKTDNISEVNKSVSDRPRTKNDMHHYAALFPFNWKRKTRVLPGSINQFSSVSQLFRLFRVPWTAAHQTSLYNTNPQSFLKLMPIELVMPSNHLILCRPLLLLPQFLPASGSFPMTQLFTWSGQNIGVWASASVLPKNIQDWFLLWWTGWISLQSKGPWRVSSNTTVQKC